MMVDIALQYILGGMIGGAIVGFIVVVKLIVEYLEGEE